MRQSLRSDYDPTYVLIKPLYLPTKSSKNVGIQQILKALLKLWEAFCVLKISNMVFIYRRANHSLIYLLKIYHVLDINYEKWNFNSLEKTKHWLKLHCFRSSPWERTWSIVTSAHRLCKPRRLLYFVGGKRNNAFTPFTQYNPSLKNSFSHKFIGSQDLWHWGNYFV